jgi:hypothetical protein
VDEDLPLKKAADLMDHLKLDQACVKTHILTYIYPYNLHNTHTQIHTHAHTHTHTLYSCHIRNSRLTYRYSTVLTALLYYTVLHYRWWWPLLRSTWVPWQEESCVNSCSTTAQTRRTMCSTADCSQASLGIWMTSLRVRITRGSAWVCVYVYVCVCMCVCVGLFASL